MEHRTSNKYTLRKCARGIYPACCDVNTGLPVVLSFCISVPHFILCLDIIVCLPQIHLVDPGSQTAAAPALMRRSAGSSSRSGRRSRRHTTTEVNHARTDSDNGSIKPGQRQLIGISPPVRRARPVSHKRSTSGPATDGRTSASPMSFGHGRSKSSVDYVTRNHSAQKTMRSRNSGRVMLFFCPSFVTSVRG